MDTNNSPPAIGEDEKITAVMAYTASSLILANVITKKVIRISTWLRTPMVPQFMSLHSAQIIDLSSGGKPNHYDALYLPASSVIAFHMRPPASDPLDYEPNEPMRKMEPASALVGSFRFDGTIRMSTQTDLERYLDVTKETFTAMYDATVSPISTTGMKPFQIPYVLFRRDLVAFAHRSA
jgi:hypothetical protein